MKIDLNFTGALTTHSIGGAEIEEVHSQNTQKCSEFIRQKISEHPFLKPLAIVLKKYLALKNLNSPFQGTMSSYGLVLMILAILKDMGKSFRNFEVPGQLFEKHLGRAFIHFLAVYGEQFSTQYQTIDEHSDFIEVQNSGNSLPFMTSTGSFGL